MINRFKRFVFRKIAEKFFGLSTEDSSIKITYANNRLVLSRNNKPLPAETVVSLVNEAKMIKETSLLSVLLEDTERIAKEQLYFRSASQDDLYAPKAVLWTIDVLKKKIEEMSKLDTSKMLQ